MWRTLTPFEKRMAKLARIFPPKEDDPLLNIAQQKLAEGDLAFRAWAQELESRLPSFILSRMKGGTKFPTSEILREYFFEFLDRLMKFGPKSFPSSFNVVESYLRFSQKFMVFDIRPEDEYLLRLDDYLDWYTRGAFPEEPYALTDIIPEGVVQSFNFVAPLQDFHITTENSELCILGCSLVRHSRELSLMAIMGEKPPYPTDDEIASVTALGKKFKGRELLEPDSFYTIQSRYISEVPGYARIIALARFDLQARSYQVRYANLDLGHSFRVLTDDPTCFPKETDESERSKLFKEVGNELKRYDSIFGFLATLMYLPAYCITEHERIIETKFATELTVEKSSQSVQEAIGMLEPHEIAFHRKVRCLVGESQDSNDNEHTINPPDFEYTSSGFWKNLLPTEVGEDREGNPIIGKTWVDRTESWSKNKLESFVARKIEQVVTGSDPGYIYIMRSGSHSEDLYKIGLTRRDTDTRAKEVSYTTGVPTSFEVLARWKVGDVGEIENEVHKRLSRFRVNTRREFFSVSLSYIIKVVEKVIIEKSGN